jgi:hypothetical protein
MDGDWSSNSRSRSIRFLHGDSRPGNLGGFCVCRITLIRGFAGIGLLKIKLLHDPTI